MKSKHSLATYASLIIGVAVLTSCGEDNGNTTPTPEDPVIPVTPDEKEAMTPDAQKEYIEKVAIEFLNYIPSSDFKEISELGKYIADTYGSNYDWDNVGDWAEDIFDAARGEALGESIESETEEWYGTTYKYNYIYTNYKSIIMASNFKGHFTAKNGKWYLTPADDLQFIFKNSAGKECVLKLAISGNVKKIHAFDLDDWYDYNREEYGNTYISNDYYNRTQYTIGIPENTVITLSQGGSIVAKATIKIDLGSIANEEFDISKNSFTGSTLVELNNGYKFNTAQKK